MRKILSLLAMLLACTAMFAQATEQHVKFMGIPLNGTITQFQSKLLAKGCTYDAETSKAISTDCRVFNGVFASKKVSIYVYYDNNTKIVYRAKAVNDGMAESIADQEYGRIKELLTTKYESDGITGSQSDKESCCWGIFSKPKGDDTDEGGGLIGEVDLYIVKDEKTYIRYPYNYSLHIDYIDFLNKEKHTEKDLEDL